VELTSNFDTFDTFLKFKKDFRKEVVEDGLDIPLKISTNVLKSELKYLVNERIRTPDATKAENIKSPVQQVNDLKHPIVSTPKSEAELIKYLTKGRSDINKYNKAKDFSTLQESGVVFGHNSRGQQSANRVTLRLEISPDETVQSQYQKARDFFQNAVFAFQDGFGEVNYYMNPGIDISEYLKIKCSVFTGDGNVDPRRGLSPEDRFNRDRDSKGFADWTLKQDGVEFIRNSFVNITEVVNQIKEGDVDRAKEVLRKVNKNSNIQEIEEQLDNLKAGKDVPETTQSYLNTIKLIEQLVIAKKITPEDVIYTLMSTGGDSEQVDFLDQIERAIRGWEVENEDYWFNSLVKRAEKLIKRYESES